MAEHQFQCKYHPVGLVQIRHRTVFTPYCLLLSAATIVQSKVVAAQGLEEGEEEEDRGKEEVEDMDLDWVQDCCTALELHAAEPAVQVSPAASGF